MKNRSLTIQFNAPVVLTFALLSLAALALGPLTGGWTTSHLFSVYRSSWTDPLTYVRLFGHVLGHQDLSHYISNMVLILVVGPPLEEKYGGRTLLLAIAVTAAVSGLVHCMVSGNTALLGASGVAFMLIMLSSLSGMRGGAVPLTMIRVAVLSLGSEIYTALTVRDNISQLTHIVGGLCGVALGFLLAPRGGKR